MYHRSIESGRAKARTDLHDTPGIAGRHDVGGHRAQGGDLQGEDPGRHLGLRKRVAARAAAAECCVVVTHPLDTRHGAEKDVGGFHDPLGVLQMARGVVGHAHVDGGTPPWPSGREELRHVPCPRRENPRRSRVRAVREEPTILLEDRPAASRIDDDGDVGIDHRECVGVGASQPNGVFVLACVCVQCPAAGLAGNLEDAIPVRLEHPDGRVVYVLEEVVHHAAAEESDAPAGRRDFRVGAIDGSPISPTCGSPRCCRRQHSERRANLRRTAQLPRQWSECSRDGKRRPPHERLADDGVQESNDEWKGSVHRKEAPGFLDCRAVLDAGRACCFACPTAEALVEMEDKGGIVRCEPPSGEGLDQYDSAPRALSLVVTDTVCRTALQAESTVHAGAEARDRLRFHP